MPEYFLDYLLEILSDFLESNIGRVLFLFIKIFFEVFTIILFLVIVILVIKTRPANLIQEAIEGVEAAQLEREKFQRKWKSVIEKLELRDEENLKSAVVEADQLLDEALKKLKCFGETISDRLKKLPPKSLSNLDEIKKAHELRNNVVYEDDFQLNFDDARKAIKTFEKAFKELEML